MLFPLLFLAGNTWAQLYTFKKYNHRSGLNTESTLTTAQDQAGYIWIGTDGGGLMKFNGQRFEEIGNYTSSNAFHVSKIYNVGPNHLYFSTLFDGLYELKNNNYRLVYKPVQVGDMRGMSPVESNFVLIADLKIELISGKGQLLKSISPKSGAFVVRQILKIPNAVILLTNNGDFAVTKNKIEPLSSWLKNYRIQSAVDLATFDRGILTLVYDNAQAYKKITFSTFGVPIKSSSGKTKNPALLLSKLDKITSKSDFAFCHDKEGNFYTYRNGLFQKIKNNSEESFDDVDDLFIDDDFSMWVNYTNGIVKITKEPFTKVATIGNINSFGIGFVYHVQSTNVDLISTFRKGLFIGSLDGEGTFRNFDLRAYGASENFNGIFIATNKGIYKLSGKDFTNANFPFANDKSCSMIFFDGEDFWYSPLGEGLCRYNLKTKKSYRYQNLNPAFPNYFYTAQSDFTGSKIYLGSNNGIWIYNKTTQKFNQISRFRAYGSYCGNSIKDKFGTLWFTLDKAIVGITKDNNYAIISDKKKLQSTLLYTLNSDKYGNLLIGTNKGINVIKVDADGHVLSQQNFSHFEGFDGYETNMRACYQDNTRILVGTIEGLFEINSSILENYPVPPKPVISKPLDQNKSTIYNSRNLEVYSFSCIMPKSKGVSFSYRILGYSNKWSNLTKSNEISLPDLDNGDYVLEVRATYDGIHFSSIAKENIKIQLPLYQNKWFLVIFVVLLGILNLAFLEWSKNFKSTKTIDTNILTIDVQLIPRLIFYCFLASIGIPFFVNTAQSDFQLGQSLIIGQSLLLIVLYFLAKYATEKLKQVPLILFSAYATYATVIIGSFVAIYTSNLHPYPVIQLCMLTSVMPFLFSKIRIVIFTSVAQLVVSICLIIVLNETNYNEMLFIIAVVISCALVIIFSFVRLDSLDKLIFVNGIVNRGNVISVSFDDNNIITYCSQNISGYFNLESEMIIGKNTSIFNDIIADEELRELKITDIFADGKSINIPMVDKSGNMIWVEWACKELSSNTKVIMGQDITEKLLLSNNYQSLVENAKDLIFNVDVNGNFAFLNEFTKKLLGYREESLIGTNSLLMVPAEYQKIVEEFYRDQFLTKTKYSYFEYPIRNKSGKIFWLGQNTTLVFEPGSRDRVAGFMVLARDITERRANDLLLEQQNKEIEHSINSAKSIQSNLLPDASVFQKYFEETFVLFKPKDVVSGDFYWVKELDSKVIIALSDCKNHGISGAFLTIHGFNLLNQIVLERKIVAPNKIIEAVEKELHDSLKISKVHSKTNAMDLLVLVIDNNEISFASNGIELFYSSNEIIHQVKNTVDEKSAKLLTKDITNAETIYLFTDGYLNQSGSISGKAFGDERLKELINRTMNESLILQKKHFENTLRNWSEGHDQNGDITVIALKGLKSFT